MSVRGNLLTLVVTVALMLALASCDQKTVYHHYEHTPLAGWERNDTLIFDVSPLAASGVYREEIGVRINGFYPFMSLYLVVEQTVLPRSIFRRDTLSCSLIATDGKVKGKGVSNYQYSFHLTSLDLVEGDSLHVCVRHNMKREILPGIADLGVMLRREQ